MLEGQDPNDHELVLAFTPGEVEALMTFTGRAIQSGRPKYLLQAAMDVDNKLRSHYSPAGHASDFVGEVQVVVDDRTLSVARFYDFAAFNEHIEWASDAFSDERLHIFITDMPGKPGTHRYGASQSD